MTEYGSEFDLRSNEPFCGGARIPESWQLFRSGRDALKAFARLAEKRRVLMPALCCESMILPFQQNGYEISFYRLREDLSADEGDVSSKLADETVLLYMRYFGIRPFSDAFLEKLRLERKGVLFLEDRTHDILVHREGEGFRPDAVAASLRKWAAMPEGGMLETSLGAVSAQTDRQYGDLRLDAMEKKSRYLKTGDKTLREEYGKELRFADQLLDVGGEPVSMHPRYRELLAGLDLTKILAARLRNLRRLQLRLAPVIENGSVRLMTAMPERGGLSLPVLIQNRNEAQRELIERRLYCPAAIWPEPKEAAGVCPVSRYVTEHMLSLLCDQRYSERDMDYLADNLIDILSKGTKR
jgi:hypothetical protein